MRTVSEVSDLASVTVRARQLGFSLQEIGALLDYPGYDRVAVLSRQRALIERDLARLCAIAVALDAALTAAELGIEQQETAMFKDFDPAPCENEARERWGDTEAYRESARRTATYGDAEWAQIQSEAERVIQRFPHTVAARLYAGDWGFVPASVTRIPPPAGNVGSW